MSALVDRVVSGFPLAIATSMAMESIFQPRQSPYDPERKIPNAVNVSKYQEIHINLATMFRNIVSSISKDAFINATEAELKDILLFEIEVIDSLFTIEGNGFCKPVYYFATYDSLYNYKICKTVKLRQDTTEAQKITKFKLMNTMKLLLKEDSKFKSLDCFIKPENRTDSLIMTHIPFDLLSYTNFNKLVLLESHTGIAKPRHLWYCKYYPVGDADLSHIPFNRKLLMVFGDRVLIQPNEMKLRRLIVEIANNRNWTAMTTESKILLDFSLDIKEPFVLDFLNKL